MKEECLICGAALEYLESGTQMECAVCGRRETSRTRCVNGHYVCNDCHMDGMDATLGLCLRSTSKNPIGILQELMSQPFCHMHGPEHHVLVGSALLTAYHNAGGSIDLPAALAEMVSRGLRRGYQHRHFRLDPIQLHPPERGAVRPLQPDDRKGPGANRNHRRSPVLQAGFSVVRPGRGRLCAGAVRH